MRVHPHTSRAVRLAAADSGRSSSAAGSVRIRVWYPVNRISHFGTRFLYLRKHIRVLGARNSKHEKTQEIQNANFQMFKSKHWCAEHTVHSYAVRSKVPIPLMAVALWSVLSGKARKKANIREQAAKIHIKIQNFSYRGLSRRGGLGGHRFFAGRHETNGWIWANR